MKLRTYLKFSKDSHQNRNKRIIFNRMKYDKLMIINEKTKNISYEKMIGKK